ncbi:hypothetical protein THAOC_20787, partial [Thalassiosira oceanica]
ASGPICLAVTTSPRPLDLTACAFVRQHNLTRLNNPMGDQVAVSGGPSAPGVFLLYEGGKVRKVKEDLSELSRVRVAPHVTAISYGAFWGYGKLVEVEFDEGLQVIEQRAFNGCTSLRSVTLPSTVTKLGCQAFCNCVGLIILQFNEGLQVISGDTFQKVHIVTKRHFAIECNQVGRRQGFL